jgi:hypothetical protein
MDTNAIVQLILLAISETTQMIGWIRSQTGLTADQQAAATQKLIAANDALYSALKGSLNLPAPPAAS